MAGSNDIKVDLHVHSNECDGASKEEIVTEAAKSGIRAIAITDHHITDGIDKVVETANRRGVQLEVIPAVELSTLEGFDIIGYLIDPRHERLNQELFRIRKGRQKRAQIMAQKLDDYFVGHDIGGIRVDFGKVMEMTINGNIAGGHFEKFVYEQFRRIAEQDPKEYVRVMRLFVDSINQIISQSGSEDKVMFDESWDVNAAHCVHFIKETLVRKYLLKRDMPCNVKRTSEDCFTAEQAAKLITEAHGIRVPAHPGSTNNDGLLVTLIKNYGMEGLEVISSKHTVEQNRNYASIAEAMGLIQTGGTDWHGKEFTPNLHIGEVHYTAKDGTTVLMPTYSMVEALREKKAALYKD